MSVNDTWIPGNVTTTPEGSGSSAGLAVGLAVLFLLLLIVAGVIIYKFHSKFRGLVQLGRRKGPTKEEYIETPQPDAHQYLSREPSVPQTPIYENLTAQRSDLNRPVEHHIRLPIERQEDLYLQCDLENDAIYSNDPACNINAIHSQDEGIYILPDS
ncbi:uncharacterized protein ACBR49_012232 [Aulostomus maculatus]